MNLPARPRDKSLTAGAAGAEPNSPSKVIRAIRDRERVMNAIFSARAGTLVLVAAAALWSAPASAQSQTMAYYQPQATADDEAVETPAHLRRQTVSYATHEPAGTIVVDTPNTY